MLQNITFAVDVDRVGIAMPAGYLPATHLLLRSGRSESLFDSLRAVVGMHGAVAVAVKNNGWDRRAARNSMAAGSATLTHGGERRGHVGGGSRRRGRNGSRPPRTDRCEGASCSTLAEAGFQSALKLRWKCIMPSLTQIRRLNLLWALCAAFDPSLDQLSGCFLISRSGFTALAGVPSPCDKVVFSDVLLQ